MVEYGRAPRSDREPKLVERKGKGHAHGFVELLVFTLVDDRDHEVIRFHLEVLDGIERLRGMDFANEVQHPLQQT